MDDVFFQIIMMKTPKITLIIVKLNVNCVLKHAQKMVVSEKLHH